MAQATKQDRCRRLKRGGLRIEEIAREMRCSIAQVLDWLAEPADALGGARPMLRTSAGITAAGYVCECGVVNCAVHR